MANTLGGKKAGKLGGRLKKSSLERRSPYLHRYHKYFLPPETTMHERSRALPRHRSASQRRSLPASQLPGFSALLV